VLGGAGAFADPGATPPTPDAPPTRTSDAVPSTSEAGAESLEARAAAARARLERRAEWLRAQQDRIAGALTRLDAGEDPEAVLADARVLGGGPDGPGGVRGAMLRRGPGGPAMARGPEGEVPDSYTNGGGFGRGDRRSEAEAMVGVDPERVRRAIAEHMPELSDKLDALRQRDPEAARMLEGRLRGVLLGVVESRLNGDDQMERLRVGELRAGVRAIEVVGKVRESGVASEEDRAALVGALTEQHELRERIALLEVTRLEERIGELRAAAAARAEKRPDEVSRLAERMIERAMSGRARPEE
jgi:hypothetical protein